jgi:hypothetical protein
MTEHLRELLFEPRSLEQTPLRRSRFLTMSAAAFFGLAGKLVFAEEAQSTTCPCDYNTFPCVGCRVCNCCVWGPGCTCCNGLCTPSNPPPDPIVGCPYPNSCWETCADGHWWKCCDFIQCNRQCICKLYLGGSCS